MRSSNVKGRVLWISLSMLVFNFALVAAWQANNCVRVVGLGSAYGDKLQECQSYLEAAWGFKYFSQSSPMLELEVFVVIVALNAILLSILQRGHETISSGNKLIVLIAALAGIILPFLVFD